MLTQAVAQRTVAAVIEAKCRFCQCTEENPCRLPHGDECCYLNVLRDRCSNPACVRAYARETAAIAKKAREEVRRLVAPIAQRWYARRNRRQRRKSK